MYLLLKISRKLFQLINLYQLLHHFFITLFHGFLLRAISLKIKHFVRILRGFGPIQKTIIWGHQDTSPPIRFWKKLIIFSNLQYSRKIIILLNIALTRILGPCRFDISGLWPIWRKAFKRGLIFRDSSQASVLFYGRFFIFIHFYNKKIKINNQ